MKFPETNLAAAYRKEQLPKVPLTELIESDRDAVELRFCVTWDIDRVDRFTELYLPERRSPLHCTYLLAKQHDFSRGYLNVDVCSWEHFH